MNNEWKGIKAVLVAKGTSRAEIDQLHKQYLSLQQSALANFIQSYIQTTKERFITTEGIVKKLDLAPGRTTERRVAKIMKAKGYNLAGYPGPACTRIRAWI